MTGYSAAAQLYAKKTINYNQRRKSPLKENILKFFNLTIYVKNRLP